jgi:hypothetical protein
MVPVRLLFNAFAMKPCEKGSTLISPTRALGSTTKVSPTRMVPLLRFPLDVDRLDPLPLSGLIRRNPQVVGTRETQTAEMAMEALPPQGRVMTRRTSLIPPRMGKKRSKAPVDFDPTPDLVRVRGPIFPSERPLLGTLGTEGPPLKFGPHTSVGRPSNSILIEIRVLVDPPSI